MREKLMKKDYCKAFKLVAVLAVILAVVSAVAVPLSLSRQLSDLSALRQTTQEQTVQSEETYSEQAVLSGEADGESEHHGEHHDGHEVLWKSRITSPTAGTLAALGGLAVLWLALGVYYWLLVVAWLYKSAVNEGMNCSLWPILGAFANLFAVLLFLIVRDNPRRTKPQTAQ